MVLEDNSLTPPSMDLSAHRSLLLQLSNHFCSLMLESQTLLLKPSLPILIGELTTLTTSLDGNLLLLDLTQSSTKLQLMNSRPASASLMSKSSSELPTGTSSTSSSTSLPSRESHPSTTISAVLPMLNGQTVWPLRLLALLQSLKPVIPLLVTLSLPSSRATSSIRQSKTTPTCSTSSRM